MASLGPSCLPSSPAHPQCWVKNLARTWSKSSPNMERIWRSTTSWIVAPLASWRTAWGAGGNEGTGGHC